MNTIVPGSIKNAGKDLFDTTKRDSKTGATYKAYLTTDQLRQQILKEEILALVGEVLWNQEIEKRIEELQTLSWGEGQESMLED